MLDGEARQRPERLLSLLVLSKAASQQTAKTWLLSSIGPQMKTGSRWVGDELVAKEPDLPKYHLLKKDDKWRLEPEGGGRAKRVFNTKAEATAGGALKNALGDAGGSVRIHKKDNRIQEEQTFPRGKDPKG